AWYAPRAPPAVSTSPSIARPPATRATGVPPLRQRGNGAGRRREIEDACDDGSGWRRNAQVVGDRGNSARSRQQRLLERCVDRRRADPRAEQHVGEVLARDGAKVPAPGAHHGSSARNVRECDHLALGGTREQRLETIEALLQL